MKNLRPSLHPWRIASRRKTLRSSRAHLRVDPLVGVRSAIARSGGSFLQSPCHIVRPLDSITFFPQPRFTRRCSSFLQRLLFAAAEHRAMPVRQRGRHRREYEYVMSSGIRLSERTNDALRATGIDRKRRPSTRRTCEVHPILPSLCGSRQQRKDFRRLQLRYSGPQPPRPPILVFNHARRV